MRILESRRLKQVLWELLVILILAFPVSLQIVKAGMIVLIAGLCLIDVVRTRFFSIDHGLLCSLAFWLVFVGIAALGGISNQNPGLIPFLKVNLFYYLLFFFLIVCLNEKESFYCSVKGAYFANYIIILYSLYLLLYGYGMFRNLPLIRLDDAANVGMHTGYTHITNTNLSMTIFTFPFLTLMARGVCKRKIIRASWYYVNLFLTATVMVLSGRRILWIVLAISLLGLFFTSNLAPNKKMKYIIIGLFASVIALIIAQSLFKISLSGLADRLKEAFSEVDEYGNENVRFRQRRELLKAFSANPVAGAGAGAVAPFIRSEKSPWVYEMTYHVVLFNGGIIGALAYGLSILTILYRIYKNKSEFRNGVLLALLTALLATATNPYISASFDFWLFLFIPMQYLSYCKENKKATEKELLETVFGSG